MLQLLSDPLNRVTSAIGDLQRDAQELRAVLYDPGKAIFESHAKLDTLFDDGTDCHFGPDLKIQIQHQPNDYKNEDDARCVLAKALLIILGQDERLLVARTKGEVIAAAKDILIATMQKDAFSELSQDLVWLCSQGATDLAGVASWQNGIATHMDAILKTPKVALGQIKAACFTSFKLNEESQSGWPLALALKRYLKSFGCLKIGSGEGLAGAKHSFCFRPSSTPTTHQALLRLLMGLAVAHATYLRKGSNPKVLESIALNGSRNKFDLQMQFADWDVSADVCEAIRRSVTSMLNTPRDWRVRETAWGNMTGAFVEFAGNLLGLGTGDQDWMPRTIPPITSVGMHHLIYLNHVEKKACFEMKIRAGSNQSNNPSIHITW